MEINSQRCLMYLGLVIREPATTWQPSATRYSAWLKGPGCSATGSSLSPRPTRTCLSRSVISDPLLVVRVRRMPPLLVAERFQFLDQLSHANETPRVCNYPLPIVGNIAARLLSRALHAPDPQIRPDWWLDFL